MWEKNFIVNTSSYIQSEAIAQIALRSWRQLKSQTFDYSKNAVKILANKREPKPSSSIKTYTHTTAVCPRRRSAIVPWVIHTILSFLGTRDAGYPSTELPQLDTYPRAIDNLAAARLPWVRNAVLAFGAFEAGETSTWGGFGLGRRRWCR